MKVRELIERLNDADPEDELKVFNGDTGDEWDIIDVYAMDGDLNIDIAPVN